MLTQEQIIYVDMLKREYSHLDKSALIKLFADAQWSEAESTEAMARFEGTYVPSPVLSPTKTPQIENHSPAWSPPPKSSRYADIIFEDLVVEDTQPKVPENNLSNFSHPSPKNILMGISILAISIAIVFILYRFA
jgi:hypothetical protein